MTIAINTVTTNIGGIIAPIYEGTYTQVVVAYDTVTTTSYNTLTQVITTTTDLTYSQVAVDYSRFYERIANSFESAARDISTIATNISTITNLSLTTGVKTISPNEWIGVAAMYRVLVEEGKLIDNTYIVSASSQTEAINSFTGYIEKLRNIGMII